MVLYCRGCGEENYSLDGNTNRCVKCNNEFMAEKYKHKRMEKAQKEMKKKLNEYNRIKF